MRKHICLAVIAVLLPLSAGAEMIRLSKCTLNPGRTLGSVESVFQKWRELFEKEGFGDHRVRVLVQHAGTGIENDTFWLEFSSPDFERYGMAWEWWYTSPKAAAASTSMAEVFSCDTTEVFRSIFSM
jgi:hypothetical protein